MLGKYWLPVAIWVIFIFTISSLPVEPPQTSEGFAGFMIVKKLTHIVEYGILGVLLVRALKKSLKVDKAYWFTACITIVLGVADEFHQDFIAGGGTSHIHDVGLDLLGAIAAIFVLWKLLPKMPEIPKNWAKKLEIL